MVDQTKVLQLCEMFPDVPLDAVRRALADSGENVDRACEDLLSFGLLDVDLAAAESGKTAGDFAQGLSQAKQGPSKQAEPSKADIVKLVSKIDMQDTVSELLHIDQADQADKELLEYYCERNKWQLVDVVFDIMENWDPTVGPEQQKLRSYRSLAEGLRDGTASSSGKTLARAPPAKPAKSVPKRRIERKVKPGPKPNPTSAAAAAVALSGFKATCGRSKVQGGYRGLAVEPDAVPISRATAKEEPSVRRPTKPVWKKHSPTEAELNELKALRLSNTDLSKLPDQFFTDALRFLRGDLDQLLYVSLSLIPHLPKRKPSMGKIEMLYNPPPPPPPKGDPTIAINRQADASKNLSYEAVAKEQRRLRKNLLDNRDRRVRAVYSRESSTKSQQALEVLKDEQQIDANRLLAQARRSSTIDLHGLLADVAADCASRAVEEWWGEELAARVENGRHIQSSKAVYVKPFEIVSGRGIHSAGHARIKPKVRRLLESSGYVFDEESARFVVVGRRH